MRLRVSAESPILRGRFASLQFTCKDRVIAWNHRCRFSQALQLVSSRRRRRLLDYGSGDGTFVALAAQYFEQAVGADIDDEWLTHCRERLAQLRNITFITVQELRQLSHAHIYDVVMCMDVFQQLRHEQCDPVVKDLCGAVAMDGLIIISVPIEIGPTLIANYLLRTLAGWRHVENYVVRERYTTRELFKMLLATRSTQIQRSTSEPGRKGFNWRYFAEWLSRRLNVSEIQFSPLGWSRGLLSSHAWFICVPQQKPSRVSYAASEYELPII
jgi:2-polyprenyl-3-methyl-5-hydroxy-6-metoxy-1,4-benzoquinol methylase